MSTEHEVRVVRLGEIRRHENADSLGITEVDGRPCILRLGEWSEGDLAVYVPIDSLCPTTDPRFAFLGNGGHKADDQGRWTDDRTWEECPGRAENGGVDNG